MSEPFYLLTSPSRPDICTMIDETMMANIDLSKTDIVAKKFTKLSYWAFVQEIYSKEE